jgi:hypothetical protein
LLRIILDGAAAGSCSANTRADGLSLYGTSQELIRVRPQPAKSPVSRVASPAPATRVVAYDEGVDGLHSLT